MTPYLPAPVSASDRLRASAPVTTGSRSSCERHALFSPSAGG